MWLEARLTRLVEEFWEALPYGPEPFPRDLIGSASLALPLAIRELPCLSLTEVHNWLSARGLADPIEGSNRRLRGCLLAYNGHGFVLVDGSDPDDEMRFTVAHELAHFLLDYQLPRRRAIEALGEEIIPVLDNTRLPTRIERLHAILGAVPIGLHVDLMERTSVGGYTSRTTAGAEEQADRLALELLAPAVHAWAAISGLPEAKDGSYAAHLKHSTEALHREYGLPHKQAQEYATWLL
nr:ImmA/IrrE family metallo-endopeptidase [Chloroflexota bacterium]